MARPRQREAAAGSWRSLAFILANIPLAFVVRYLPAVATLHALVVLAVGLFMLTQKGAAVRVAPVAAYMVGAEILWRGSGATIPWEFGKYAIILLLGLALLKRWSLRHSDRRALVYFLLLLPSILVMATVDRRDIAFNLSGPASLAVATLFFSAMTVDVARAGRILTGLLAPIVGLAALASAGAAVADPDAIRAYSTAGTAGIGTNQVSTVLGLGLFAAILLIIVLPRASLLRRALFLIALWLAVQTLLSMSRGGLWAATGSLLVAAFFLARNPRYRRALIIAIVFLGLTFQFVVFPALDSYLGGRLATRFSNFSLTGRDRLIRSDLDIFQDNPFGGVGPGGSKPLHAELFRRAPAHTEFSRMLSEHGAFGLAAFVLLTLMTISRWRDPTSPIGKAWSLGFALWALLTMGHAAMRLAAPGFMFGLAAAHFIPAATGLGSHASRLRQHRIRNHSNSMIETDGVEQPRV